MKKIYETINKIGYPIVLKPLDGNHGKGASINVNWKMLFGLAFAKEYSKRVIVENLLPVLILESW
jgi:cyanophycin synthetase